MNVLYGGIINVFWMYCMEVLIMFWILYGGFNDVLNILYGGINKFLYCI